MGNSNTKLRPRQQLAIQALLENRTVQGAAAAAGIGSATLYRWLADDTFKTAFREAKLEIVRHAMARLQKASGQAVDTITSLMTDLDAPPSVRLGAGKVILEMTHKFIETEDLAARIDSLERRIQGGGTQWRN